MGSCRNICLSVHLSVHPSLHPRRLISHCDKEERPHGFLSTVLFLSPPVGGVSTPTAHQGLWAWMGKSPCTWMRMGREVAEREPVPGSATSLAWQGSGRGRELSLTAETETLGCSPDPADVLHGASPAQPLLCAPHNSPGEHQHLPGSTEEAVRFRRRILVHPPSPSSASRSGAEKVKSTFPFSSSLSTRMPTSRPLRVKTLLPSFFCTSMWLGLCYGQ